MNISYDLVLGVGVLDKDIKFDFLTEYTKGLLKELLFEQTSLENLEQYEDEDALTEALEELYEEIKHGEDFLYDLGLDEYEGNLFSGWIGRRGVGIKLNIDTIKEDVEKAVQEFKKIVNLEPELFYGVLVC